MNKYNKGSAALISSIVVALILVVIFGYYFGVRKDVGVINIRDTDTVNSGSIADTE